MTEPNQQAQQSGQGQTGANNQTQGRPAGQTDRPHDNHDDPSRAPESGDRK